MRPWSQIADAIPVNAHTRRPYRGVNFTLLSLEAHARGFDINRWLTYRHAQELGGQVRKGEQGTPIVFWQLRKIGVVAEAYPEREDDPPAPSEKVYPLLRAYTVFNVAQIDGLDVRYLQAQAPAWEPEAKAEELLLMSGARFRQGGARAFYQPATDEIHLPPRAAFAEAAGYYNVALHELTHWTGTPGRCQRDLTGRFGDAGYAAEELVAEMGAAYLCAYCRIDGELRHASYLQSWLKVLRSDKLAIFTAAAHAQRAADYVLKLAHPPEREAMAA
ncbi:MAG TPA: zincin-like metallopeptidase domain-containing protein [Burkholderiales bacterium]|nr:zincin-like metallopeptidase domain-containing protein [Burkholderiales bacterium]